MKRFWQRVKNHFVPSPDNAYRPHLLRRGWMVFFLALVLATEGFLVASLVARQSSSNFLAAVIQSEVIALTNGEREQNSVGVLLENPALDAAAQAKANDMAQKGYFAHLSPDGKTPWDFIAASGYSYQYAGENLAVRFSDSQDVVNAWMASPTHRANIVKPQYTQIGVGIAEGMYLGQPATFVAQYFGAPLAAAPAATPVAAKPAAKPAPAVARAEPASSTVLGTESAAAPAAAPAPAPVVTAAHETPSLIQSITRTLMRSLSDPRESTAWVFGGIAALLVLLIGLAFFFHIQVQATGLLLPGMAVAGIAVFFLLFNGALLPSSASQAAGAALAGGLTTVIDDTATSTP
jgi:uncharacterized protein YkwD